MGKCMFPEEKISPPPDHPAGPLQLLVLGTEPQSPIILVFASIVVPRHLDVERVDGDPLPAESLAPVLAPDVVGVLLIKKCGKSKVLQVKNSISTPASPAAGSRCRREVGGKSPFSRPPAARKIFWENKKNWHFPKK